MYRGMGDDIVSAFLAFVIFVGIVAFGLGYLVVWFFYWWLGL